MTDKRTYADRAEYLKKAVTIHRKKIRDQAIDCLGGRCQIRGYERGKNALDFHHKNPKEKYFGISQSACTRAWLLVKSEVQNCVLICANCHREVHAGITQLPMETSE